MSDKVESIISATEARVILLATGLYSYKAVLVPRTDQMIMNDWQIQTRTNSIGLCLYRLCSVQNQVREVLESMQ